MTTLKTLYGIIFFVIWAAVGWITARHGKRKSKRRLSHALE